MDNSILEVKNLRFSYGDNEILKGVDFKVEPESVYCIFGPNGCGKSTMLNCILGLSTYNEGDILVKDKDIKDINPVERAMEIAYVTQKSDKTFPYTCREIVLMGRTAYSGVFSSPGKEDIEIADEALRSVGMYGFRDRPYTKLSGGETQLIKIARAIAQDTDIIVFDEPTSHLDFRHELNVIKFIVKLVKEKKKTALMATHFPNHALFLENQGVNTKVAMMEKGVFRVEGTPSETLTANNMDEVFKVETKRFNDKLRGKDISYIVPVDFTEGGEWNK